MPSPPSTDQQEQELEETRQRIRNLVVSGLRDDLTPDQLKQVQALEAMSRTEARLRRKGLEFSKRASKANISPDCAHSQNSDVSSPTNYSIAPFRIARR